MALYDCETSPPPCISLGYSHVSSLMERCQALLETKNRLTEKVRRMMMVKMINMMMNMMMMMMMKRYPV